jgi:hypothetical protein
MPLPAHLPSSGRVLVPPERAEADGVRKAEELESFFSSKPCIKKPIYMGYSSKDKLMTRSDE